MFYVLLSTGGREEGERVHHVQILCGERRVTLSGQAMSHLTLPSPPDLGPYGWEEGSVKP